MLPEVRNGFPTGSCDAILAAWRTNNRVTLFLFEHLPPELWAATVPGAPRRTIRMIAGHIHNARCMWIKTLGQPHGLTVPPSVDRHRVGARQLLPALRRSSDGITGLLQLGCRARRDDPGDPFLRVAQPAAGCGARAGLFHRARGASPGTDRAGGPGSRASAAGGGHLGPVAVVAARGRGSGMRVLRSCIVVLALGPGLFMTFDGLRALILGDYLTPTTGPYAGQLGPWSSVVSAVGIAPRSSTMKVLFVIFGVAWLGTTAGFLRRTPWSARGTGGPGSCHPLVPAGGDPDVDAGAHWAGVASQAVQQVAAELDHGCRNGFSREVSIVPTKSVAAKARVKPGTTVAVLNSVPASSSRWGSRRTSPSWPPARRSSCSCS